MLQLKKRYDKPIIYKSVEDDAMCIYDSIIEKDEDGEEITEEFIKSYIQNNRNKRIKKETLTFALKGAFDGLDLYLKYKNDINK